jgi:hypothetical protein
MVTAALAERPTAADHATELLRPRMIAAVEWTAQEKPNASVDAETFGFISLVRCFPAVCSTNTTNALAETVPTYY